MKTKHIYLFFLFMTTIIVFISCGYNSDKNKIISTPNCDNPSRYISFSSLIDSAQSLHGNFIETEGYYEWAIEKSALSKSNGSDEKKIWLNFDAAFWNDSSGVSPDNFKIENKRITVKGIIDTSDHGHLGQYVFTLKQVCFIEW